MIKYEHESETNAIPVLFNKTTKDFVIEFPFRMS